MKTLVGVAVIAALGTVAQSAQGASFPGSVPTVPPLFYRDNVQGHTPAAVHANFPFLIESRFQATLATRTISHLSNLELQDLISLYQIASGGSSRLQQLVNANATATAQARFAAARPIGISPVRIKAFGASPNLDMTFNEVYLEFRTAPFGGVGVDAALAETTIFAGGHLLLAWQVGYTIGTAIHGLIEKYDPALDNLIGSTIAAVVDDISQATTTVLESDYINIVNEMFGVTEGAGTGGDYGVAAGTDGSFQDDGG